MEAAGIEPAQDFNRSRGAAPRNPGSRVVGNSPRSLLADEHEPVLARVLRAHVGVLLPIPINPLAELLATFGIGSEAEMSFLARGEMDAQSWTLQEPCVADVDRVLARFDLDPDRFSAPNEGDLFVIYKDAVPPETAISMARHDDACGTFPGLSRS
jgi:hypothetical protein